MTVNSYKSYESFLTEDNHSRVNEILHIKCPIIRLVECQMNHMENKFAEITTNCLRKNQLSHKIWRLRWLIISCILMVFLMISLFLYGTLVGAGMCSAGTWQYSSNSPCPKTFSFLPGFNWAKSAHILTF